MGDLVMSSPQLSAKQISGTPDWVYLRTMASKDGAIQEHLAMSRAFSWHTLKVECKQRPGRTDR
jgi:hypothetical protein